MWGMIDPMYYLFALPALILGLYAQWKVKAAYSKYQSVRNTMNMSGFEVGRRLLERNGLTHVGIEGTPGQLSDHYDPRSKKLYLSEGVAQSPSVAAIGVVAHEVGHALQDQQEYLPLRLRAGLVPIVQLGSWLGPIIFLVGILLSIPNLPVIGLLLFSGTLVFALVTLPVELDASRRAVAMLQDGGMLTTSDEEGVRAVLSAAALTYVAAVAQALSTILYYLFLLSGSRRRD